MPISDFQYLLKIMNGPTERLKQARDEFVTQWGAMGPHWGINRTMAQIHALLMTSAEALSTDEVMEQLEVSRGNAHANLKELVAWGLVRVVLRKGDRREYFEAEKDVWKIFTMVARERKRREIDPALAVLRSCAEKTADIPTAEGLTFHSQMRQLEEFVDFASRMSDKVGSLKHSLALQLAAKMFG